MSHNNKSSGAAKHIDIKYYVVKDKARDHIISLEQIRTEKMLTDPLIKGLPPSVQKTRSRHGFKGKPMIPGQ